MADDRDLYRDEETREMKQEQLVPLTNDDMALLSFGLGYITGAGLVKLEASQKLGQKLIPEFRRNDP